MIVRMGILKKKSTMTDGEFRDYWLNVHGPLIKHISGVRRYHQNHIVDRSQLGITYERSGQQIDGFSELWFNDVQHMEETFNNAALNDLTNDESKFLDSVQIIVAYQNEVVPPPKNTDKLLKRMSLIKKRSDIDEETFRKEWEVRHAELVRLMPGIKGYIQNVITDRKIKGKETTYDDVPFDGMVEFWFEDKESIEKAFSSEQGVKTMAHSESFLEEITTFLVETHKVI